MCFLERLDYLLERIQLLTAPDVENIDGIDRRAPPVAGGQQRRGCAKAQTGGHGAPQKGAAVKPGAGIGFDQTICFSLALSIQDEHVYLPLHPDFSSCVSAERSLRAPSSDARATTLCFQISVCVICAKRKLSHKQKIGQTPQA